jgi:hypothetical protein
MKKFAFALVASLFILSSCGKKAEEGTHTHDDGSVHTDHATDTTKQEEFNAADTTGHHHHDSTDHSHSH